MYDEKQVPEEIKEKVRQVIKDNGYSSIENEVSSDKIEADTDIINPDENTLDRG